ncbi:hypothetical protein P7C71_g2232, partial [Lecanoromycetidae sp. Uapishka_2]
MASTIRASSFLPTIKCSSCGIEIPISNMGDHMCAPEALPKPHNTNAKGPALSGCHSLARLCFSSIPELEIKERDADTHDSARIDFCFSAKQ